MLASMPVMEEDVGVGDGLTWYEQDRFFVGADLSAKTAYQTQQMLRM